MSSRKLINSLKYYTNNVDSVLFAEKDIINELKYIYSDDSTYKPLIQKLENSLTLKREILKKEMSELRSLVVKN